MTKRLPPDPENMNDARARWATTALQAFRNETDVDEEDALADLLCDLMHLADRKDWSFRAEMERAQAHYKAETTLELDLLTAAHLVVERWSSGDLAEAVRSLHAAIDAMEAQ